MGEYFGSAVCAVDLDNDKLDDLLVGAPLHSKHSDEGKVYVFKNMGNVSIFRFLYLTIVFSTSSVSIYVDCWSSRDSKSLHLAFLVANEIFDQKKFFEKFPTA